MFQDHNIPKPKGSENLKNPDSFKALQDVAQNEITGKAGEKLDNANQKISKAKNIAGSAQSATGMFSNQLIPSNKNLTVSDKLWANQPTSKILNANAIPTSQILGINRVVKLEVVIEGKEITHFKNFKLNQSAVKHHNFSLTLAHDTLGGTENHNLEDAQNFLGKRLTVIFKYKDVTDGPERNFVGVITSVGFSQDKGSLGNIVLKGYSPTILLDAATHIQSFGGAQKISLNSIADQVIQEGLGGSKFDFRVDAQYGEVSYSSQYEETHYNYLARIAEAYGEQFFYDGEVLHFGKLPPQEESVKLIYGSSVTDVQITMQAQHVKPSFYGYNSSKNEKLTTGDSKINHVSDIARRAYEISEKTFTTPSLRIAPIKASSSMDIDASQKGAAGSKASSVFVTSGTTTVPFLYPGCPADIEMRKSDSNQTSYFTKLLITEVTHEVDARGYYTGNFEAIAADSGYIPRPEFESPKADAQFAKVISNTDPMNQGRVQVQFDWQQGQDKSEFIRVMTPDAGSSDKVNKNRGFMAIPEVGDQVIVNFVHQHPDRPFVMGGMFHGGIGAGGGANNDIKSLSSRSGNKLELNDGAGSVFLTDQGGANMKFDGGGNATTNANSNHSINAGSTHTTGVGGKKNSPPTSLLKMDAAGNITLDGKTSITLRVGDNSITISEEGITASAGKGAIDITALAGALGLSSTGGAMNIETDSELKITGGPSAVMSSGDTNIM
ncbi:phage baseplate assembly protein V [Chryseobacterium sp. Leaf394]|uniref:type VI secretion system Vgr family protein n=1 Tax=Chryseobacterium sp. Leaf394 TaxID=1736361 RepID=UPI0006F1C3F8|nr:phage baseplate assembly protein V [Chryseobacterium sp. Leaf394]KQS92071.1 Vgr family protein [Chryseobacterium sp. Leaf394]